MMGRRDRDQASLFYDFNLDDVIPENHLLRRIDVFVTRVLADVHKQLEAFYSDIGRPSFDPELMLRMLIVGYCYGIRHERKLCEEASCTWPIAGSASLISMTRFRTTRPSRRTVSIGSVRVISCGMCLSGWFRPA
jgi:hypothetical protein